jgi:hypothetical protein
MRWLRIADLARPPVVRLRRLPTTGVHRRPQGAQVTTARLPRGSTPLHRRPTDDDEGAFDWDPKRPLAEQWPWSGVGQWPLDGEDQDETPTADALLAAVRECTPEEIEAEHPPADVATAIERIAELTDEETTP